MKLGVSLKTLVVMFALTLEVALPAASVTSAHTVRHSASGWLPGYPALRGVMPVLGSSAALSAHEKLVNGAFAAARIHRAERLRGAPVANEGELERCQKELEEEVSLFTQNMCYRGGPVLHDPTIHLIFWQGQVEEDISKEPHVKLFPAHYVELVERYFEDLAHDSGSETNVFAIDPQYWEEQIGRSFKAGEYNLSFDRNTDVTVDTTNTFPQHLSGCSDPTAFSEGPCLLDSDLQKEVQGVAGTSSKGLGDLYVVLTPPGVGGCFDNESGECAYRQYCAYHSDFGGDGMTAGQQTLYADLPYLGEVPGCDSLVHPNEIVSEIEESKGVDNGADAVIGTASHEVDEVITDPIGSQCDEKEISGEPTIVGCEKNAWTDAIGQEVADKCLPPESTVFGIYGEPLGELLTGRPASLFNQEINADHYWTQRQWSNEAGLRQGACVQRRIEAAFSVSASRQATVPMTLNGSSSGAPGDPVVYWVWEFLSTGEQIGTSSPVISHTFAQAGAQLVALTVYDAFGNSQAGIGQFEVGAAPPPPSLPPAPTPLVIRVGPTAYTAAQVATKLGLPANGKKLSGGGPFSFGRAECPPACAVTLQLSAKTKTTLHKHRTTRLVPIGAAHLTLAAKSVGVLSLSLNAKGKQLLHKLHHLACKLAANVEGQEGGSWQIVRSLVLKD
jgi:hypothetical protein